MKELTVDATLENIEAITEFVDSQLEDMGCPLKIQTQFDIAIDEIVSNIANYAYSPEVGQVSVRIEVTEKPLSVVISFMDGGMPFDPLAEADPDISLPVEERKIGGLGIYLVKKSMDDISYEYKEGKNILSIRKNL